MSNTAKKVFEFRIRPQEEIDRIEQTLEEYRNCVLCGTQLEFHVQTDFIQGKVTEESTCPECKIRKKSQSFQLQ